MFALQEEAIEVTGGVGAARTTDRQTHCFSFFDPTPLGGRCVRGPCTRLVRRPPYQSSNVAPPRFAHPAHCTARRQNGRRLLLGGTTVPQGGRTLGLRGCSREDEQELHGSACLNHSNSLQLCRGTTLVVIRRREWEGEERCARAVELYAGGPPPPSPASSRGSCTWVSIPLVLQLMKVKRL